MAGEEAMSSVPEIGYFSTDRPKPKNGRRSFIEMGFDFLAPWKCGAAVNHERTGNLLSRGIERTKQCGMELYYLMIPQLVALIIVSIIILTIIVLIFDGLAVAAPWLGKIAYTTMRRVLSWFVQPFVSPIKLVELERMVAYRVGSPADIAAIEQKLKENFSVEQIAELENELKYENFSAVRTDGTANVSEDKLARDLLGGFDGSLNTISFKSIRDSFESPAGAANKLRFSTERSHENFENKSNPPRALQGSAQALRFQERSHGEYSGFDVSSMEDVLNIERKHSIKPEGYLEAPAGAANKLRFSTERDQ